MKILIISDLHANLEALRALPSDYDELWALGDLVNYGPNPSEVIEFVRRRASLVVRGNHDDAIGYDRDPVCSPPFRVLAAETGRFTQSVLSGEQKQFLRALPLMASREACGLRFLACHATPEDPLHEYRPADSALWAGGPGLLPYDVLLSGHTHIPVHRRISGRLIVNPGSVGQSKTVGGRAFYAILEDGQVSLRSVEYPVEETVAKLQALPLPPEVTTKLATVLRTGSLPPEDAAPPTGPAAKS